ncbi:DUF4037 domain-containing protein [Streptomyces sp. NPDC050263]|uniref:DUF4037 domain-containing protein n=1 Tax=Streptomyces sp. NPDC050263 TaxID=3155037 RepID=UPI003414CAE1
MSTTNMPPFIPGLELSRRFYTELIRPLLEEAAPGIPHSAARLGSGSEVLGLDTAHSAHRERVPRLQLFLRSGDVSRHAGRIRHHLSEHLPKTFHGRPTRAAEAPVHRTVEVTHVSSWFAATLGFDPSSHITPLDWLATPTQLLAGVTAGAVFHDGLRVLAPWRAALRWYPHDLWLHVLACQWQRLSQEEALVGHCGEMGDELGSAVVTARLVRDLMRLCLLMDRHYPPGDPWLGSAFARTAAGSHLTPVLAAALAATDRHGREEHLTAAFEAVAALHNQRELTDPLDPVTTPCRRFAAALLGRVTDPAVRALPTVGAVDQFVDSAEVLGRAAAARAAAAGLADQRRTSTAR